MTFGNGNYLINNPSGATINIASSTGITNNGNTTISAPLVGTNALNISGSGTLILSGVNSYKGVTTVSNGTLNLTSHSSGSSMATPVVNLMPGSALTCDSWTFGWYGNNNPGGLTINVNGATCQPNIALGASYTLTGGSIVGGSDYMNLGAAGGFNSFVTTYSSPTTSVIKPGGGYVSLRPDYGQTNYTFAVAKGTTPNGIDLDMQVRMQGPNCSVIKTGDGTMRISGANTYSGGTVISNGTLLVDGSASAARLTVAPSATLMILMNRAANTYGKFQSLGTVNYGGTLVVTNVGGTFQPGDTFNLFGGAATYNGSFASTILPPLPAGQSWSWSPSTGVLSVTLSSAPPTLTWDANPGHAGTQLDGDGTWDLTTTNWWDGTNDVAWAPAGIAQFGGGGGGTYEVTLAGGVSQNVSGMIFNNGNYYIEDQTGVDGITLVGSPTTTPLIQFNNDTEIDVPLAGASGLNISGPGKLTLTTQNTYTGVTTVSNATLNLPTAFSHADTALRTSVINLMPGSALTCNSLCFGWYGSSSASGLTININGATCQPNGAFGIAYTLTGGSIAGSANRLDLGSYNGFNTFITTYASATTSVINPGGGFIYLRNDSGQTNYTFTVAKGTTPSGIDLDMQVRMQGPNCSVIKTGAGTMRISGVNTYNGGTVVSNGTLLLDGVLPASAVTVKAGATLTGAGTIGAAVNVNGTLAVGLGQLAITNKLTLNAGSSTTVTINRASNVSGSVQGITAVSFGGTLVVTNIDGAFQAGDAFTLFGAATYSGNFSATVLPPLDSGLNWSWSPTTGVLSVIAGPSLNPTSVRTTVADGTLNLSWPMDHTGWRLLMQTNNLLAGLSSNTNDCTTVSGSTATNSVYIPIDAAKPSGFYRLVYP